MRLSYILLLGMLTCLTGCTNRPAPIAPSASPAQPSVDSSPLFEDVTTPAGIHFAQKNGADPNRPLFPETTPAGCAFFDYDNDGWLDILLIQSGSLRSEKNQPRPHCALYHNNHNGTFTEVTVGSGLDADLGYAHGVAIGDIDNDGYDDVFITAFNH